MANGFHRAPHRLAGFLLVASLAGAGACSPRASSVEPDGVAGHESAAVANESLATAHAGEAALAPPCADVPGIYDICWTRSDTAASHAELAERHRVLARHHRDAAERLRETRADSCRGVAPADQEQSPFSHLGDISTVELLDGADAGSEDDIPVVRITFVPRPGLTVQSIEAVIACHIAVNAALGHDLARMPACPLVPRGVRAVASEREDGVGVTLSASESAVPEVRERARLLAANVGVGA